jgi:hypothetical protein
VSLNATLSARQRYRPCIHDNPGHATGFPRHHRFQRNYITICLAFPKSHMSYGYLWELLKRLHTEKNHRTYEKTSRALYSIYTGLLQTETAFENLKQQVTYIYQVKIILLRKLFIQITVHFLTYTWSYSSSVY